MGQPYAPHLTTDPYAPQNFIAKNTLHDFERILKKYSLSARGLLLKESFWADGNLSQASGPLA